MTRVLISNLFFYEQVNYSGECTVFSNKLIYSTSGTICLFCLLLVFDIATIAAFWFKFAWNILIYPFNIPPYSLLLLNLSLIDSIWLFLIFQCNLSVTTLICELSFTYIILITTLFLISKILFDNYVVYIVYISLNRWIFLI